MLGMHKRQGDQSYPDKAISIEVMMALMARFDAAWEVAKGQEKEEGADLFPASSIATASASFRSPSPRHQLPFVLHRHGISFLSFSLLRLPLELYHHHYRTS
jgi:hypothetical protein